MNDSCEGRARTDSSDVAFRKIFIGGLSYSTDEEKLKKYFKQFGSVQDAVVMKDPISKRSRGFGFITFFDVSSVDSALEKEPHTIDGRKVEAKRAVPKSEMNKDGLNHLVSKPSPPGFSTPSRPTPGSKLNSNSSSPCSIVDSRGPTDSKMYSDDLAYHKIFVGGLHYDTRDAEFQAYFERFGKVISAEVMFNRETHKSRGFGFIVYENEESVDKVCAVPEHVIGGKMVEVKRAIPRAKMAVMASPMTNLTPSTPAKESTTLVASSSPPNSHGTGSTARSRRAISTGNAQPVPASPVTLSGNSCTMTVSTQKPTSTPVSSRKSANISLSGTPPMPPRAGLPLMASYATAVAGGGSHMSLSSASHDSIGIPDHIENAHRQSGESPTLQSTGISLLNSSSPTVDVRNRALSEPIYFRNEGSSALDGEILPYDLLSNTSVGVIQPSSNNSSRSNSVIGPSVSTNNLPWLSSPSTVPFEPNRLPSLGLLLPPASQENNGLNNHGAIGSESLFGGTPLSSRSLDAQCPSSNLFYNAMDGGLMSSEQDDYPPSLRPPGRVGDGGTLQGNRMRASSLNALGTVPVPDNLAALLQSHIVFQESLGIAMSPIAAHQRQQHQMFTTSSDTGNAWSFNDGSSSLFESSQVGSSFGRAVSRDGGFSRVLGFTESSCSGSVLTSNASNPT